LGTNPPFFPRIPIPPHGQIQMIKRDENDHKRTSDDNDDV